MLPMTSSPLQYTLRSDYLADVLTLDSLGSSRSVYAYFRREEDARAFAASLPKFIKAEVGMLRTIYRPDGLALYGLAWHRQANGSAGAWCVSVRKAKVSKVTGASNETGDRRMAAFVKALAKLEYVPVL